MTTIKEQEQKIELLKVELKLAETTLHSMRMVAAGVSIGDIVVGTGRFAGKRIRIVNVDSFWNDKAWIVGNVERADGSFGTATRNIFDHWEKQS